MESLYRGSFARSKHVGFATLHVYRMAEAHFEHVGLTALHHDRMGESRFEHVGLTTLHVTRPSEASATSTYLLTCLRFAGCSINRVRLSHSISMLSVPKAVAKAQRHRRT